MITTNLLIFNCATGYFHINPWYQITCFNPKSKNIEQRPLNQEQQSQQSNNKNFNNTYVGK